MSTEETMKTDTVELPKPNYPAERDYDDAWTADQMREYAAQLAAAENYGLLSHLADIRKAAGDPTGKLMQSELVEMIARQREECDQMRAAEKSSFAEIEIGLGPKEKVKLVVRGTRAEIRAATQKINRWNRKHSS